MGADGILCNETFSITLTAQVKMRIIAHLILYFSLLSSFIRVIRG